MYSRFGLVLLVNHACNLRCDYCYTGAKFARAMPEAVGRAAIGRALASLVPGGTLELGFFGGEPLLEAVRVAAFLAHARTMAARTGVAVEPDLTTNGTVATGRAWEVMTDPDLRLALSCDGLPAVHDRHRRSAGGRGTAARVVRTMERLRAVGKDFHVVLGVRPDTLAELPDGILFLRDLGVREIELSLDLWSRWTSADAAPLAEAIARCATLWRQGLPRFGISPFNAKLAALAGKSAAPAARCGFGDGEVAVAPSGRLYPCERVIGEDPVDHPLRLPGLALEGSDFLAGVRFPGRAADACRSCALAPSCDTTCRCSNFIRTGDPSRPDRLLCWYDQLCTRETARAAAEFRSAFAC